MLARQREDQSHRQLRNGGRISAGGVGHHDPASTSRLQIHLIDAHPVTGDHFKLIRDVEHRAVDFVQPGDIAIKTWNEPLELGRFERPTGGVVPHFPHLGFQLAAQVRIGFAEGSRGYQYTTFFQIHG